MPAPATQELLEALMHLHRVLRSGKVRLDTAGVELNRAEVGVLRRLERQGEIRSGDLAEGFGLSPSVISRQVASLVERGLVARRQDPSDARASLLSLTAAGRRGLDAMTEHYVQRLADVVADWDASQQRDAARLVDHLADRLADRMGDDLDRTDLAPTTRRSALV